ncbi:NAD-P-binding protein [Multifurca ochricompacta]|uniref:NAD-P-binding protein n=1 Tax=Multifurca ochricompacta TaxID=376703 RepID=A0AAD4MAR8_9AGAM|nr:NAD-P-binding protein [Multifurca ochricompacta]
MASTPIRTCVLGVGLAGLTFHIPFILALPDLFTLTAVLERNSSSPGGKLHERFGISVHIHRTLHSVLEDPNIDLIVVGTPNATHYEFAKSALLAGKHVLVDKPVTTTAEEAKELGELARSKNLVLYPFQNRRWDSDFLALRRLLSEPSHTSESLGDLVEFNSHFDRYRAALKGTWKDEAGPASGQTYDLGSHLIDQALVLFGRPKSITAFIENARNKGDPDVDDSFTIFLRYPAGTVSPHPFTAILRAHVLSVRASQLRYKVRGTQGTFIKYGLDTQEDQLRVLPEPNHIHAAGFGSEPEELWGTLENLGADGSIKKSRWPSTEPGGYVNLFRNLASVIRDGAEQGIKWEESVSVIEIVELAHQSSKERRTLEVSLA